MRTLVLLFIIATMIACFIVNGYTVTKPGEAFKPIELLSCIISLLAAIYTIIELRDHWRLQSLRKSIRQNAIHIKSNKLHERD